ncbi:MAG: DNA primase [Betaproteobacteria bacterium]|nr:DNA primase [Betaproteobacteria bacterium]MDE2623296.1 DNA primase [Betaproteobacteria bacterium]
MIPRDFIQTLLGRVDIVDTIERYIPLKKAGANYVARCPFHSEKSPSFSVSPSKQFYYCFGCGASGTALGFVMEYTGAGFVEAVHELAQQAGLDVPEEAAPAGRRHETHLDLSEALRRAADYYRAELKASPVAIQYLKQRGLTGTIAARFGLGYAPDGWRNLSQVFPGYESPALVESGLVIDNGEGKRYDRFRARVMFPILDSRGEVIGFGGRIIGPGEPKYLNSPETPLFEKGRELYGLPQARRAIRDSHRVVVVEGYMDVVALAQAGVEYAVATLGTATSAVHVQKLLRMADQVVFAFDGDQAGRNAAQRALEVALPHLVDGKQVSFLFLPEGEDPDSFVRSQGAAAFEALLGRATPASEFMLEVLTRGVDMTRAEGRAQFLQAAKQRLGQITAPALALLLRKRVAALAQVEAQDLELLMGKAPVQPTLQRTRRAPARAAPSSLAERLLACLLHYPELAKVEGIPGEEVAQPDELALRSVAEFIRDQEAPLTLAGIVEHFRGLPEGAFIQEALRREFPAVESSPTDQLAVLYREGLGRISEGALRRTSKKLLDLAHERPLTPEEMQLLQETNQKIQRVGKGAAAGSVL